MSNFFFWSKSHLHKGLLFNRSSSARRKNLSEAAQCKELFLPILLAITSSHETRKAGFFEVPILHAQLPPRLIHFNRERAIFQPHRIELWKLQQVFRLQITQNKCHHRLRKVFQEWLQIIIHRFASHLKGRIHRQIIVVVQVQILNGSFRQRLFQQNQQLFIVHKLCHFEANINVWSQLSCIQSLITQRATKRSRKTRKLDQLQSNLFLTNLRFVYI